MFGEKLFGGVGYPTPLSIPDETTCLLIQVPANDEWWALMVGVLYTLTLEWNWQQFEGGIERDEAAAKWQEILDNALDIASISNECSLDVPAPYWDDTDAADADDQAAVNDQPWYGEIVNEGVTFEEQIKIWLITGFLAIAATPAAAISFLPFANRFVLAFKQHSLGAKVKVFLEGIEMIAVDTYAPVDGVLNVPVSIPAAAGLMAFDAPTMWVVMSEEVNPAVIGAPSMQVIRKRLDQTDVTPENLRWNEDCDCVQQTPDNGTTWVDSPSQDPRTSTIFQVPPRTDGDPQCDSAAQMKARVKNMLDAVIASSSILQAINGVVGIVAVFMFDFGIIVEAIWAIVSAIFSIGTTVLDAALTDPVYDALQCIFFCRISTDGSCDQDQYDAILSDVALLIGGVAGDAITLALSSIGTVGLSNAGALGEITGDCSGCECEWCVTWDFTISDGSADGWVINGQGEYVDGEGYRGTFISSVSQRALYIYLPCSIDQLTFASFEFTKAGGSGTNNVNNFRLYHLPDITAENLDNTFGSDLTKELTGDFGIIDEVDINLNSGDFAALIVVTHVTLKGFGTPPGIGTAC